MSLSFLFQSFVASDPSCLTVVTGPPSPSPSYPSLQTTTHLFPAPPSDLAYERSFFKKASAATATLICSKEPWRPNLAIGELPLGDMDVAGSLAVTPCSLFIGGVPESVTQPLLLSHFSKFLKHGGISSIQPNKGHAIVTLDDVKDAWRFMRFQKLHKRNLAAKAAETRAVLAASKASFASSSTSSSVPPPPQILDPGSPGTWFCNLCCQKNFKSKAQCYRQTCDQLK